MTTRNSSAGRSGRYPLAVEEPIHLAGATLDHFRHVCAFFRDLEEQYSVLIPFIIEGLQRGEKVFHTVDPKMRAAHLERLQRAGIDVRRAEETGHLEVRSWGEVQLLGGRFNKDRMLGLIAELLVKARSQGFPGTRFIADMQWALTNQPGTEDFLELEAKVTRLLMDHKDPVICIYDPSKFGGGLLVNVVRTHPVTIVDGVLQEHPFFSRPKDLIRELRQHEKALKRPSRPAPTPEEGSDVRSIPPKRLRSAIRDFVGALVVPATWRNHDSNALAQGLLELMTDLVPLEFAFASMVDERGGGRQHFCKIRSGMLSIPVEELARSLESEGGRLGPFSMPDPRGEGFLRVVTWPLGVNGRWGRIAAGSREGFQPTDLVLLRAASTQAVIALDAARNRALEAEKSKLQIEKLRAATDLAQLRAHLEPHFLLNTLNAIAGLVTMRPSEARQLLVSLGDLLRDLLTDNSEMQTLGAQIEWLRRYAEILEIRHAGRLAFRWQIAPEATPILLPRLLLQPLLENAIRHGALHRQSGGEVIVRAEVVGRNGDSKLVCIIEDNGPRLREAEMRAQGQGLSSVEKWLAIKYGDKARLRLESFFSGTKAIVELPLITSSGNGTP